jgi:hypothetical protein
MYSYHLHHATAKNIPGKSIHPYGAIPFLLICRIAYAAASKARNWNKNACWLPEEHTWYVANYKHGNCLLNSLIHEHSGPSKTYSNRTVFLKTSTFAVNIRILRNPMGMRYLL